MFSKRTAAFIAVLVCAFAWTFQAPREAGAQIIGGVANYFLQSGSGAIGRTFNAKMSDTLNAKDFGVICDGTTDDTANIRLAAAQAYSSGQILVFPNGECLVSGTITLGNNVT